MSTIVQQPDSLYFSQNLRKFVVVSDDVVTLKLSKGVEQILNEFYQPGVNNLVEIDLRTTIDRVLSVSLPDTELITEQYFGVADFTAIIDSIVITFRVITGGVAELQEQATSFTNNHFLTWQIQNKKVL